jgi:hypothetical protein
MEKLLLKNVDAINKLNQYIDNNINNISMILASPETGELLKHLDDCDIISDNIIKYKGISVKIMEYFSSRNINFVLKDTVIKFDLPCICGLYSDEQHLHL